MGSNNRFPVFLLRELRQNACSLSACLLLLAVFSSSIICIVCMYPLALLYNFDFRVLMLKECLCGVTIKPISSEPNVVSMKNGKKGNVLVRIGHASCYARHER